jgi:hypothetical protein
MFSRFLKTDSFLNILSWATLLFSVVCSFSIFDEGRYNEAFSSDSVGMPCIYKDLVLGNGQIKDWYFASAPTLFPDVFLYFLTVQIFGFDVVKVVFFYALLQVIIVNLLSIYIFKQSVTENLKKYKWLIPLFFSTLFIECYYFSTSMTLSFFLASYSYHVGAFVNCLIALCLFLSPLFGKIKYPLLVVVSVLAVFSDMLYIVMLTGPLLITVFFTKKKKELFRSIIVTVFIAASSAAGYILYEQVKKSGYAHFIPPHRMLQFDYMIPSLNIFIQEMIDFIKYLGFRSFLMSFTFISIILCSALVVIKRKELNFESRFLLVFFTVFSVCVFSAPIVNGNYSGYDTLRYSVSPFYFTCIILALSAAYLIEYKIPGNITKKIFSFSLPLIFLIMIFAKFSFGRLKDFFAYSPKEYAKWIVCAQNIILKTGYQNIGLPSMRVYSLKKTYGLFLYTAIRALTSLDQI